MRSRTTERLTRALFLSVILIAALWVFPRMLSREHFPPMCLPSLLDFVFNSELKRKTRRIDEYLPHGVTTCSPLYDYQVCSWLLLPAWSID